MTRLAILMLLVTPACSSDGDGAGDAGDGSAFPTGEILLPDATSSDSAAPSDSGATDTNASAADTHVASGDTGGAAQDTGTSSDTAAAADTAADTASVVRIQIVCRNMIAPFSISYVLSFSIFFAWGSLRTTNVFAVPGERSTRSHVNGGNN